jgi:perosamine synthetase
MSRNIPLSQPYLSELEAKKVCMAVDSGWLTQTGRYVEIMESQIGMRINGKKATHSVTTTSNGTTALHLVLMAIGIGPGDEVIVPDFGYIAPVNSILMCGATPVTVDVDLKSWCINPHLVTRAVTDKTKAVIVIDNYGVPAKIREIKEMIPENVFVIEDAAESFPSLSISESEAFSGDFVTTSFYANKILTSAEGGAITGPSSYIEKIKSLKNQSVKGKGTYEHIDIGYNYRISNLHAALFTAQWERLPEIIENRIRVFDHYYSKLRELEIEFESNQYPKYTNPWLMTIRLTNPTSSVEKIRMNLSKMGIETRPGFKPASEHDYLKGKIRVKGDTTNSKTLYREIISLPTYPELSNEDIEYVCNALKKALVI